MRNGGAGGQASWRAGRIRAWSRYRDNSARTLIGISRDLQSRVMQTLSEDRGFEGLRPSLGPFLSLIWSAGRPVSEIAAELAISNQACSQLANLAQAAGYLERRPNPQDRRSKLVRLTPRGRSLVEQGARVILESESEYAELVGASAYRRFAASLVALYRGLGLPTHTDPALMESAGQSVGVLPLIAVRIQQELMQATTARGHAGLKMSHGQVLPLIGPRGARIYEIARVQRVSRQAISATARDLEKLGYLQRERDPHDRRGVVLTLTERGADLIDDSVVALGRLERSFRDILGARHFEHLKAVARDLYRELHLEQEIFESERTAAPEIERLATRLQEQLGTGDAAKLAALLENGARRATQ